jgi:DNA-binding transcriptional LysR family regulator
MDLDLRLARHFVVLADTGHFSRAAARLHLSQSALTKQVQALERQAGVVLIDRSRRPWQLTAAGAEVLALSRDLCARADRAARGARNGARSDLTIGFQSSGSAGWPIGMILLASQEAFQRPVGCRVLDITAYVTALMDGEIDVLVTRPAPRRPGVLSMGVLAEPRMLLVPRRWPEADAATLATAEAAALPLVYNLAMSPGDNGVWALGDVRPLREARLVASHGSHFVEMLPDLISGKGAMTIAPPLDELLPATHARAVALPDAPPVETAVCWRADGGSDDQRLAATVADALVLWALRQQRSGARWAPAVCRQPTAVPAVGCP